MEDLIKLNDNINRKIKKKMNNLQLLQNERAKKEQELNELEQKINSYKPEIYFATNLRYLRKKANKTHKYMAELLGLAGKSSFIAYENKCKPSLKNILKLSLFFEVSVDDLITKDLTKITHVLCQKPTNWNIEEKFNREDMIYFAKYFAHELEHSCIDKDFCEIFDNWLEHRK